MLVSIQKVRLKSDFVLTTYMLCFPVQWAQFSVCVRVPQTYRSMHTCAHAGKSERLTRDYYTTEKAVWFRARKACVRITGCWHQSPGLVVDERVSLDGAWHGREEGERRGRGAPGSQCAAATMAGTVRGPFTSGYCHTQWCEEAYASNRGKGEKQNAP